MNETTTPIRYIIICYEYENDGQFEIIECESKEEVLSKYNSSRWIRDNCVGIYEVNRKIKFKVETEVIKYVIDE